MTNTYTVIYKANEGHMTYRTMEGKSKAEIKETYGGNGIVCYAVLTQKDIDRIATYEHWKVNYDYNRGRNKHHLFVQSAILEMY